MPFDWKKTLGAVAPGLATALGGPLAGLAVKAIGDLFGLEGQIDDEALSRAIAGATPADMLALKKADQEFMVHMEELGVRLEELAGHDRASARDREKSLGGRANGILAAIIVGGFLLTVFMVLAGKVEGIKDLTTAGLVGTLIGYVSAKADQVVAYYFGSTATSRTKTDAMAESMKNRK